MKKKANKKGKAPVKPAVESEVTPNLRLRRALMRQITAIVKEKEWTQSEAAERCGVSQPRINDLLRGRVSRFSLDALVNLAAKLGGKVTVVLEARR